MMADDGAAGPDVAHEPDQTEQDETAGQDEDTSQAEPAGPERKRRRWSWLTEMVVLVALALLLTLVVKAFIVQPFVIPSQSMQNTLLVNDRVLVDKLVGHIGQIHRGDIIVFDGSGSWDGPSRPASGVDRVVHDVVSVFGFEPAQTDYIKRVIGLPGDHVSCCNAQGLITVNGVPLHESAYLYPGSQPSVIRFSVIVPAGQVWVMGDNRADSDDSRLFHCGTPEAQCNSWDRQGTIPESMVIGRAFMIIWPLERVRLLPVPKTFDQPGLNSAPKTAAAGAGSGGGSSGPASSEPTPSGPAPVNAASSSAAVAAQLAAGGLRVAPASSFPLWCAGVGFAVPLTLLERRVRLRRRRRAGPADARRPGRSV
jgi:signal peptidase I